MDEIKKSRQFILCATVLRYSYVRKIDDNQVGWGYNFQNQTKEEYQRWIQLVKSPIPNCERYPKLENLGKVMSWAELEGYEHFDLGTTLKLAIDEAEQKMKDKKDDDFRLYKNSIPDMNVLDVIKKEVGQEGSSIPNMAVALRNLGLAMFKMDLAGSKRK